MLRISYFAWVRERMGIAEEAVALPDAVASVADLIAWLAARDEAGARAFAEPQRICAAVDGHMAGPEAAVPRSGEVALFPPVTGG
ncbi:MAG TPA: molybdopterin converting factor subunit 1 [Sphingopyxis sp.]|nr:molybdopterin converting factor subunit 1 [Sphingopyxis sp.]HMP45285.1 molybdopterin converting factor subunit 1 [Sphingopyxis sp.]HMQ20208.1 molybdopterin converting factor subunit 1 [Sphingopyxis sp.]